MIYSATREKRLADEAAFIPERPIVLASLDKVHVGAWLHLGLGR
jgi:hypothetical protein